MDIITLQINYLCTHRDPVYLCYKISQDTAEVNIVTLKWFELSLPEST